MDRMPIESQPEQSQLRILSRRSYLILGLVFLDIAWLLIGTKVAPRLFVRAFRGEEIPVISSILNGISFSAHDWMAYWRHFVWITGGLIPLTVLVNSLLKDPGSFHFVSSHQRHIQVRRSIVYSIVIVPLFVFFITLMNLNSRAQVHLVDGKYGKSVEVTARDSFVYLTNLLFCQKPQRSSELETIRLYVADNTLLNMQDALQTGNPELGHEDGGTKPYFKATYIDDSEIALSAKVALRGWGSWHHDISKPSLRVRVKKADIRNGRRYHELSRPEDVLGLKNWIPQQIAPKLGLLSNRSDHIRLFLNNRYFGVYERTMRHGERLAIENGRMPGTFFKGDAIGREGLWDSLDLWDIEGETDPTNLAVFQALLQTLGQPASNDSLQELDSLLHLDSYANWSALMIATGSIHDDDMHNHSYFLCSNQGKIEVIPWDCNSFGIHAEPTNPVDEIRHPVMRMAIANPVWVHHRNQTLWSLLNSDLHPENFQRFISEYIESIRSDLQADTKLRELKKGEGAIPYPVTHIDTKVTEICEWMSIRYDFLLNYLKRSEVKVYESPRQPGWSIVSVGGNVAVHVSSTDANLLSTNSYSSTPEILYPGLRDTGEVNPITSQFLGEHAGTMCEPVPLLYLVHALPSELQFTNAVTGERVFPKVEPIGDPTAQGFSVHPSLLEAPETGEIIIGPGEIILDDDIVGDPGQPLTILPGTYLKLAPGVGIYSQGKTTIVGTSDAPIFIEGSTDQPWGCVGINGAQSRGTRIEYVHVKGGSTGTNGIARFKGMFNVYDCPDVVMRHSQFGKNEIGDDAVNFAESNILIEDCDWDAARSDALDLDMCTGIVRNCRWTNSGNDSLDMMTCRLLVEDCQMTGSGDKGMSVGEQTQLLARRCKIRECLIGTEVKDASRLLLQDSAILKANVAIHSYQKKWLYPGGGISALVNCEVKDSQGEDVHMEKRCGVTLIQTPVVIDESSDHAPTSRVHFEESMSKEWREHEQSILDLVADKRN